MQCLSYAAKPSQCSLSLGPFQCYCGIHQPAFNIEYEQCPPGQDEDEFTDDSDKSVRRIHQ